MSDDRNFTIRLADAPTFGCRAGESVLAAMQRHGIGGLVLGCRSGGCGVCRVHVQAGCYRLGPVGRNHLSEQDQENGFALACRLFPEADLEIVAAPYSKTARTNQQ
ncbi:MAG: 2Fe-2S iron-sulfur cluster binding domain-containing protein [Magnetospirillum sp.]|nr:2Fe-2S iron-sulfur cluster binding domain-containing protein [Magnetospirillum sp.]